MNQLDVKFTKKIPRSLYNENSAYSWLLPKIFKLLDEVISDMNRYNEEYPDRHIRISSASPIFMKYFRSRYVYLTKHDPYGRFQIYDHHDRRMTEHTSERCCKIGEYITRHNYMINDSNPIHVDNFNLNFYYYCNFSIKYEVFELYNYKMKCYSFNYLRLKPDEYYQQELQRYAAHPACCEAVRKAVQKMFITYPDQPISVRPTILTHYVIGSRTHTGAPKEVLRPSIYNYHKRITDIDIYPPGKLKYVLSFDHIPIDRQNLLEV